MFLFMYQVVEGKAQVTRLIEECEAKEGRIDTLQGSNKNQYKFIS